MSLMDMLTQPDASHLAEGIQRLKDIRAGVQIRIITPDQAKALLAALVRLELELETKEQVK